MNWTLSKPAPLDFSDKEQVGKKRKFGTFMGAYVPSILMLFGVIVFLRLGWIVGVAGLSSTFFYYYFGYFNYPYYNFIFVCCCHQYPSWKRWNLLYDFKSFRNRNWKCDWTFSFSQAKY